jgi:phosphinothricin acetyltransferase
MDIVFEELSEEYLGEVLSIYNHYVANTTASFHTHAMDESEMRGIVFFKDGKYKTFLIRSGGNVCGYVLLTRHKAREAYDGTAEVTIYLKPECTRMGLGTRAIEYIERYAKGQKFHVLVATVCGENIASIGLFQKSGFEKCAHYKEVGYKFGRFLDLVALQKII